MTKKTSNPLSGIPSLDECFFDSFFARVDSGELIPLPLNTKKARKKPSKRKDTVFIQKKRKK